MLFSFDDNQHSAQDKDMSKTRSTKAPAAPPTPPKRGRGRPRLGDAAATRMVAIRLTASEADALAAAAAKRCTSVSELLRPAIAAVLAECRAANDER